MANRLNPIHEARRKARWVLAECGREIRIARYQSGMTQRQVGRLIGRSGSWISRIEAGKVPGVSVAELSIVAAAVGLHLYVNTYPGGRRPLDAPQLDLLNRFNARLHPSWSRELEKVMPKPGDLRAADEFIQSNGCSCSVEAITRFASVESQVRSAHAKQRDLGATRLILVVKGSRTNRRMLNEAGPIILQQFPIATRAAFRALQAGEDPGGDCLILV
ncbi:MAG TPA: helix-turn-helix transcriptional regulator [Candidatus Limnocylindria bacterium]|nr:helix-turn-helix transcriptional regulator [Candidatus Limnocylindria bacterium]